MTNEPFAGDNTPGFNAQLPVARARSFRWRAFGIHLGISLTILGVLLYVLYFCWFPGYLFDTDGGWQALRVIAGVDIVLGPVLTLIAANPTKPIAELRKDFAIIALIQASALSFGVWLAWDNRPYGLLWYDGAMYSMPYSAFRQAPEARKYIAGTGIDVPVPIFVDLPLDPMIRADLLKASKKNKTSAIFNQELYRAWPPAPALLDAYHDLLMSGPAGKNPVVLNALKTNPAARLIPVQSRYSTYFLMFDSSSGKIIGPLDVEPDQLVFLGFYAGAEIRQRLLGTPPPPTK